MANATDYITNARYIVKKETLDEALNNISKSYELCANTGAIKNITTSIEALETSFGQLTWETTNGEKIKNSIFTCIEDLKAAANNISKYVNENNPDGKITYTFSNAEIGTVVVDKNGNYSYIPEQ